MMAQRLAKRSRNSTAVVISHTPGGDQHAHVNADDLMAGARDESARDCGAESQC